MTATPRGLRNNNPLNIRHTPDRFQGEITGTDPSFKTFESMPHGYRAAFVILGTYNQAGHNTIAKIVARWAPPAENNTQAYITHVEKYTGIPSTQALTTADGPSYILIVAAMSFLENGQNPNITAIQAGQRLQTKITMPTTR